MNHQKAQILYFRNKYYKTQQNPTQRESKHKNSAKLFSEMCIRICLSNQFAKVI